ncbi:hypothetical protein Aca07nite_53810 [Actinoplanes capillaceus]|uniref:Uncharacterized protein n=1 Tax=Actinoplanes campanulatus TaxID=113559 RepID=A0ABQ3WPA9_9ACTN|nr:hypothetical protein [Actinoplanes capillaceus]GID48106.1 hypothetical protein Aca07nite_53810 [Actinoplanes capillaceus]
MPVRMRDLHGAARAVAYLITGAAKEGGRGRSTMAGPARPAA